MNVFAHVFLTLVLINLMHLTGTNVLIAFLFGVLIDLDHLAKVPRYIREHGFKFVKGYPFRTTLQEPIILLLITPACFIMDNFVPLIFFMSHLFLDYLMEYEKKPLGFLSEYTVKGFIKSLSKSEMAVTAGLFFLFLFFR